MQKGNIAGTLAFIARALGDKMGVKVIVGGLRACTDGDRIFIPSLPADSKKAKIIARGYIDHESAHVKYTDFDVPLDRSKPLQSSLQNILEDVRIEGHQGERWPGCKQNLAKLVEELVADGKMAILPESGEITPAQAFLTWVLSKARLEVLQQTGIKSRFDDAQEVMEEIFFDKNFLQELGDMVDTVRQTTSTGDVAQLTEDLLAKVKDWLENPPPQQPNQSPEEGDDEDGTGQQQPGSGGGAGQQGQDDSDASDGDGQGSGSDSDDDSDADGNGDGTSDSDDDQDSGGSDSTDSDADESNDSSGSDSDDDSDQQDDSQSGGKKGGKGAAGMADALEQLLNASEEEVKGFDIGEILQEELEDMGYDASMKGNQDPVQMPEEGDSKDERISGHVSLDDVRESSVQLRGRLAGLVQASQRKTTYPKRSGRKIDKRYISRVACGDTRVFQQRIEKVSVNTAVMILIDRSGSMGGSQMTVARESALSSALALESIPGVSVATAAFPSGRSWNGVVPLTQFGQSPRATAKNYAIDAGGGTPLTEALYWAGYQLMSRPEPRKILIVATDGEPNDPDSAKAAVDALCREGIECLGLGIMTNVPARYFPEHGAVFSLKDLPPAIFGMLQQKLVAA